MYFAAVYVLYNPDMELLNRSLSVTLAQLDHIYVIDNSEGIVTRRFNVFDQSKITYIPLQDNMGIAYALNIGCQKAKEEGCLWVLTMDQDSVAPFDMIVNYEQYINSHNSEKLALVGCVAKMYDGEFVEKQKQVYSEAVNVYTSGSFINLSVWEILGRFKEDFFIDSVDYEYCLRLLLNNYQVHQLGYVILEHHLGDTKKMTFCKKSFYITNHNYIRRYYMIRNMLWVKKKYGPLNLNVEVEGGGLLICKVIFKIIVFESDKIKKIVSIFRGYLDFKRNKFGKYSWL